MKLFYENILVIFGIFMCTLVALNAESIPGNNYKPSNVQFTEYEDAY